MANNEGVVFLGRGKVQVQSIDYPKFQNPSGKPIEHGVILKIVSSNICGSDQHMVRGRATAPVGMVLGHEIPGLYVTEDPGSKDEAVQLGNLRLRLGLGWAKSHRFATVKLRCCAITVS